MHIHFVFSHQTFFPRRDGCGFWSQKQSVAGDKRHFILWRFFNRHPNQSKKFESIILYRDGLMGTVWTLMQIPTPPITLAATLVTLNVYPVTKR